MNHLKRREFLKASAAFAAASAAGGFSCVEIASAAPIQLPTIGAIGAIPSRQKLGNVPPSAKKIVKGAGR